jgi:hypothetical protein
MNSTFQNPQVLEGKTSSVILAGSGVLWVSCLIYQQQRFSFVINKNWAFTLFHDTRLAILWQEWWVDLVCVENWKKVIGWTDVLCSSVYWYCFEVATFVCLMHMFLTKTCFLNVFLSMLLHRAAMLEDPVVTVGQTWSMRVFCPKSLRVYLWSLYRNRTTDASSQSALVLIDRCLWSACGSLLQGRMGRWRSTLKPRGKKRDQRDWNQIPKDLFDRMMCCLVHYQWEILMFFARQVVVSGLLAKELVMPWLGKPLREPLRRTNPLRRKRSNSQGVRKRNYNKTLSRDTHVFRFTCRTIWASSERARNHTHWSIFALSNSAAISLATI